MRKLLLLITTAFICSSSMAQVADKDQWTCSGMHENLYDQLNAGKTVVIAMQGLDCPGCIGNAPYIDSFATNNKAKVRVWSALQLMAGSGGTCADVASWEQTQGYKDVFTFLDSTNYWIKNNPGAEFLVISPSDKKVKWKGFDRNTAFAEARKIFDPTSVSNINVASVISIFPNPAQDVVNIELKKQAASVNLYSIDGRVVHAQQYAVGKHTIDIATMPSGVYVMVISTKQGNYQARLVKQ